MQQSFNQMSDAELRAIVDVRDAVTAGYADLGAPLPLVVSSTVLSNANGAQKELLRRLLGPA